MPHPRWQALKDTWSSYSLAVKAGIAAVLLIVVVTIVLFVELQPRYPEISLTSAVFSSPDANDPSTPPFTSAPVFSPAVTGHSSSTNANFQFTFSVHNPNHKFNAGYESVRATVGYCPAEPCNPLVLLAQSSVPHFLLSGGQTTTVDASLAGYVPPEVAAGVTRDAGKGGSGVFVVNLSAKLRFKPWLPWNNEVVAVCRHVVFAHGSSPLLDQPVKCDTIS